MDLDFTRHEGGVDVAVRPHDNSWGPLYLRGGLNLSDDLEGHNAVNLLVSVTRSGLNALGAEWRNEFQAGQARRFFSELYQPLSFGDRWFAAVLFEQRQDLTDVYADREKIAEYGVESRIGGVDLGLQLGEYGEVRLGVGWGSAEAKPEVGSTGLPSYDVDAAGLRGRLVIDRLDSAGVPRDGEYLFVESFRSEPSLGSDLRYDKLSGGYSHFGTVRRQTWFLSLAELPEILGTGVYAGGWFEAGNVWQTSDAIGDNLIYTATAAAAAETRLGALYFAYGLADDGHGSLFLSLGQRF